MKWLACASILLTLSAVTGVEAQAQNFPRLSVTEPLLGSWDFEGVDRPLEFDVLAGTPLNFSWVGDASAYGGRVVAYRYAWNLLNPSEDDWDQEWSATITSASTRSFTSGTQTFLLQARDDADSITWAQFRLAIHTRLVVLTVTEPDLGSWDFHTFTEPVVQLQVESGTELSFSWLGNAEFHGGTIDAYRHGWDISDPGDDAQWTEWCSSCLSTPVTSVNTGSRSLHVQVRDNTGARSTATINIEVTPLGLESATWSGIKDLYRE